MSRRKKPKISPPAPNPGAPGAVPDRPRFHSDALEPRILLSGTWVDADTGAPLAGPTSGDDAYTGTSGSDSAAGGLGDDSLSGLAGNDSLDGGQGNDDLFGGDGDDILTGGTGDDNLLGGNDNDLLTGGDGNDTIDGGAGTDTVSYSGATAGVTVDLNTAGPQNTGGAGIDTITNVENITGSAHADNLTAANAGSTIDAGAGNDIVTGGNSADTLIGGSGDDIIDGGGGNDIITGGNDNDTITGGAGNDSLDGGSGNDTFIALDGDGNDVIIGGTGTDTVTFAGVTTGGVNANLAAGTATSNAGTDSLSQIENITGTEQDDILSGNSGNNAFSGGGGDDFITGGTGNDALDGGAGIDTVNYADITTGGVTVNLTTGAVSGSGGTDTVSNFENVIGTGQNDNITGNTADNTLQGGGGADTLSAGAGNDTLDGGTGNDVLLGGTGDDSIDGGGGTDTISYSDITAGGVTVDLNTGTATGAGGNDTFTNIENITGSNQADTLIGNSSANTISGGSGDDLILGGIGNDILTGGSGTDTVSYTDITTGGVTVNLNTGAATGAGGTDTLSQFENVTGTGFADVITGNSSANTIIAGAGNDIIDAGGGNDLVYGGAGDDNLIGGSGTDTVSYSDITTGGVTVNLTTGSATGAGGTDTLSQFENVTATDFADVITGSSGTNTIIAAAGNDSISAGSGNDVVYAGTGDDVIDGGSGTDLLSYSDITAGGITLNMNAGTVTGAAGNDSFSHFENVTATSFDDIITGNSSANTITAGAGNDTVSAGDGNDVIYAGTGDDSIDGGTGTDTLNYSDITGGGVTVDMTSGTATGAAGNDTFTNIENITGSNQDDVIAGNAGANTINAGAGNDLVSGGLGNDNLVGGSGTDTVSYADVTTGGVTINLATGSATGAGGNDAISQFENVVGTGQNDSITGDNNANTLIGGAGNDAIDGGGGNDILDGGLGSDILTGGTGTDTADYSAHPGAIHANLAAGTVVSGADTDTLSGIEVIRGSAHDDTFTLGNAAAGAVYTIDGGGGSANILDIAQLGRASVQMTPGGGVITVELPGGGTATVNFTNIQRVILADADFDPRPAPPTAAPLSVGLNEDGTVTTAPVIDPAHLASGRAFITNVSTPANGSVTLNADGTFTYTPAPNFSGTDTFTYSIDDVCGTTTATVTMNVTGVADAPTLSAADSAGLEDAPIAINISAALTDSSEVLSVRVSGLPSGASLSAGTANPDGSWTLTPAQLPGLTVTPPNNYSGTMTLTIDATSADGASTATTSTTLDVEVTGVADTPAVSAANVTGAEDSAIALNLSAAVTDSSETLSVRVSGLPSGASLSVGTQSPDGSWTLTPAQLSSIAITPPANFSGPMSLTLEATSAEAGTTASSSTTFTVDVTGVADAPTLSAMHASGPEDTPIPVTINAAPTDPSETVTVRLSGMPAGSTFSAGSANPDGSWTVASAQLPGLALTLPEHYSGTVTLTVAATSTDGASTATTTTAIQVNGIATADAPILSVSDAAGFEDAPIALNISAALTDTSETLSIRVAGLPSGSTLSAGTSNPDGSWTLAPADLAGLTLTPPPNYSGTMSLTVAATSEDGSSTATISSTMQVNVAAIADVPNLTAADVTGNEDSAIALNISASLADSSETLSLTINGVPSGATLSAGTQNPDGSWSLAPADLAGLTVTPPANYAGSFALTIAATSSESMSSATTTANINVTVAGVADAPTLSVADVTGAEDSAIALNLSAALTDSSESLAVRITGVPSGASLSAGTQEPDGSWSLAPADLAGLSITPPPDYSGLISLIIDATSTDGGSTATTTGTIAVNISGVADAPTLAVLDATGTEDAPVALNIIAALADSSETLSVRVTGLPSGASLSAGTANPDGSWSLTPAQLAGLTITPPPDYSGTMSLTISATSADGSSAATTSAALSVTIEGVADAPTLIAVDASGTQNTAIALNLSAALTDSSEALTLDITDLPAGTTLSAGTQNPDGSWTLAPNQLAGLTLTPPPNYTGTFTLTIDATSTDGASSATTTTHIDIEVTAPPPAPPPPVAPAPPTPPAPTPIVVDPAPPPPITEEPAPQPPPPAPPVNENPVPGPSGPSSEPAAPPPIEWSESDFDSVRAAANAEAAIDRVSTGLGELIAADEPIAFDTADLADIPEQIRELEQIVMMQPSDAPVPVNIDPDDAVELYQLALDDAPPHEPTNSTSDPLVSAARDADPQSNQTDDQPAREEATLAPARPESVGVLTALWGLVRSLAGTQRLDPPPTSDNRRKH